MSRISFLLIFMMMSKVLIIHYTLFTLFTLSTLFITVFTVHTIQTALYCYWTLLEWADELRSKMLDWVDGWIGRYGWIPL